MRVPTGLAAVRGVSAWAVTGAPVVFGDRYGRLHPAEWWWTASGLVVLAVAVALVRTRPLTGWLPAAVGAGHSNAGIARRLHLTEGTVKGYVSAVLDRLAVGNRVQAAIVAYEAGLV